MQLFSGDKFTIRVDDDGHLYLYEGSTSNGGLHMKKGFIDKIYMEEATIVPGATVSHDDNAWEVDYAAWLRRSACDRCYGEYNGGHTRAPKRSRAAPTGICPICKTRTFQTKKEQRHDGN